MYTMHDSIENQAAVWIALIVARQVLGVMDRAFASAPFCSLPGGPRQLAPDG